MPESTTRPPLAPRVTHTVCLTVVARQPSTRRKLTSARTGSLAAAVASSPGLPSANQSAPPPRCSTGSRAKRTSGTAISAPTTALIEPTSTPKKERRVLGFRGPVGSAAWCAGVAAAVAVAVAVAVGCRQNAHSRFTTPRLVWVPGVSWRPASSAMRAEVVFISNTLKVAPTVPCRVRSCPVSSVVLVSS